MAGASNYPNGFTNGLTVRGVPIHQAHPGKVFWLNNSAVLAEGGIGGSDGNDGSYKKPFSTLEYAYSKTLANRGDIIMVMPGHSENIATAGAIAADVAGVALVGLGMGTLRPQFRFTAAAATMTVTAANMSFHNIQWVAAFADVAVGLNVSAVDGLSWENCWFTEEVTAENFVDTISLATGADDISWNKCTFIGADASNDAFITGVAHDGFYISDCSFAANVAQTAAHGLVVASGNVTNTIIKNSFFRSNVDGALWVDFDGAACGGFVANCYVSSLDTAGATSTGDFTGGHFFECYVSGDANAFGLVGGGGVVYANA